MTGLSASGGVVRIDVLICTFRRPSVEETLRSVEAQHLPGGVSIRAIVADNDDRPSASSRIAGVAAAMTTSVVYVHAPARNISLARNACLDRADGDFVAFIDDDEVAAPDWLAALYRSATQGGFDAVFGPAIARYDEAAPNWIRAHDYHSNRPLRRGGEAIAGCRMRASPLGGRRERHQHLFL